MLIAIGATVLHSTPGAGVSGSTHHHLAQVHPCLAELLDGREHVVAIGIGGHRSLMARLRFPSAMEVVGHHVVEINVGINARQVEVGQLIEATRSGNRNLNAAAAFLGKRIKLGSEQLKGALKVQTILIADGIGAQATTTWVFPIEINVGEKGVPAQRIHHVVGEGFSAGGIIQGKAEIARKRPATKGKANVEMGVELLKQIELMQVASLGRGALPANRDAR